MVLSCVIGYSAHSQHSSHSQLSWHSQHSWQSQHSWNYHHHLNELKLVFLKSYYTWCISWHSCHSQSWNFHHHSNQLEVVVPKRYDTLCLFWHSWKSEHSWHSQNLDHSWNSYHHLNHLELVVQKMYGTWCLCVSSDILNIPDIPEFPLFLKLLSSSPTMQNLKVLASKMAELLQFLKISKKISHVKNWDIQTDRVTYTKRLLRIKSLDTAIALVLLYSQLIIQSKLHFGCLFEVWTIYYYRLLVNLIM